MMTTEQRTESSARRSGTGRGLVDLNGLGVGALLLLWLVIVPMDPVCPAIGGSGELPPCTLLQTGPQRVLGGA